MSEKKVTHILLEDITSDVSRGPKVVYGKKGEKVTEISNHAGVVIVEGASGTRYSVRETRLQTR